MNQALTEAERVVAVSSPAYFHSEYARDELTAALVRDRVQNDRLLPVRVAECEMPPLIADRIYVDLVGLEEQAAAQRLLTGVRTGRDRPGASGRSGRRQPGRCRGGTVPGPGTGDLQRAAS
jgi:hypothetical protein